MKDDLRKNNGGARPNSGPKPKFVNPKTKTITFEGDDLDLLIKFHGKKLNDFILKKLKPEINRLKNDVFLK